MYPAVTCPNRPPSPPTRNKFQALSSPQTITAGPPSAHRFLTTSGHVTGSNSSLEAGPGDRVGESVREWHGAVELPVVIALDSNPAPACGACPAKAESSSFRSHQHLMARSVMPDAPTSRSAPAPVISAADILSAPLADVARWSAAGLLVQASMSSTTALVAGIVAPGQELLIRSPHARPHAHCEAPSVEPTQSRQATIPQPSYFAVNSTGLPSPNASPSCSPVATIHLAAGWNSESNGSIPMSPISPMSLLSPALPLLDVKVSHQSAQHARSAAGHEMPRAVPPLAPASWRAKDSAHSGVGWSSPHPHVLPRIPVCVGSCRISPTPSAESSASSFEFVNFAKATSRSPSSTEPAAVALRQCIAVGSPMDTESIPWRSAVKLASALKPASKSFKSLPSWATMPVRTPSSPKLSASRSPQRAQLPPNTRIVREAAGGVAFEFSTPTWFE
ncbi:hypothetical protein BCR44DRAFT_1265621 [Catenaria anguillulae PL171]|uniref:Uncharacterized protein n=1 Tax=Catenaria anguillulae PL171 TaxID=765915 RepID=A0A1Y2HA84_9FUNG|nr:hypothetical protein BCR44DRAFT_1265621 [Catenaria anguillulae PL171]